ncbi:MAG: heme-dependent oxidative N-demethylase subunit alpha family protein, partial [Pseudomonadota bacterium]
GLIYGRCNWFITPTGERRWLADGDPQAQFAHVTPDNAGETLFVRSERQTLRRLPETGAILFTIGVYVEPLARLTSDNLTALALSVQNLVEGEGDRRGASAYAEAIVSYSEFARERVS